MLEGVFAYLFDRRTKNLLVYVHACNCANTDDPENLQFSFLNQFKRLEEKSPNWNEVHLVAHEDFSSTDSATLNRPYSLLRHWFYKSGIPDRIRVFDFLVLNKTNGYFILGMMPVVRALFTGFATGALVGVAASLTGHSEATLMSSMVGFASAFVGFGFLERQRTSRVSLGNIRSDGSSNSMVSTVYSALKTALRPQDDHSCADAVRGDP